MPASEAQIRDALCLRLDLVEPGLTLLKKEQYIPSELGTRGFVDLFASDAMGRYVIIELKRSGPASREAIHELLKYVEGVKTHFATREDEVRTVVISTEWDELLVPFSSFVSRDVLHATGYILTVDQLGNPTSLKKVDLVDLTGGRLLAPWHDLNLYLHKANLERGIKDYEGVYELKGIESYVMVILSAHPDFREQEIKSTAIGLAQISGQLPDFGELRKSVPEHKYILYCAHQQLTEEKYRNLLAKFPTALENVPDEAEPEEMIYWLHLALNDADPRPKCDYYEIGYPAKFGTKLLVDEQWQVERIIRHGSFARNVLLADSQIIADLSGEQGITKQSYVKTFRTDDHGQLSVIKDDVKFCLRDNPAWRNQILRVLDDIGDMARGNDAQISIFNPSNMLLATYLVHRTGIEGQGYIPNYFILVGPESEPICLYTGLIRQVGKPPPLSKLISRHFGNSEAKAVQSLLWGGYEENDAAIMREMGLSYQTVKVQFTSAGKVCEQLVDYGWETIEGIENPLNYFYRFLQGNSVFVREVFEMYSSRWNGSIADFSPR